MFGPAGPTDPILFIDLSNPRNIDTNVVELGNVSLYDMDGLKGIAHINSERRKESVAAAEVIIENELDLVRSRIQERRMSAETIKALYETAAEIREAEYAKAMQKLRLSERDRQVVHAMVVSMTKRMLADATESLKDASMNGDGELISAAERLFRLKKVRARTAAEVTDGAADDAVRLDADLAGIGRDDQLEDSRTKTTNGCMTR